MQKISSLVLSILSCIASQAPAYMDIDRPAPPPIPRPIIIGPPPTTPPYCPYGFYPAPPYPCITPGQYPEWFAGAIFIGPEIWWGWPRGMWREHGFRPAYPRPYEHYRPEPRYHSDLHRPEPYRYHEYRREPYRHEPGHRTPGNHPPDHHR